MLSILVLTIICSTAAYEWVCPDLSQRRFRALRVCQNTSVTDYACLFDIYLANYIESCDKVADFVLPGEQYVISGTSLNLPCIPNSNRYQPFRFWSNIQSKCYYQKSLCKDVGQYIYSQNSTKDDSTCRCDHVHGYGFVIEPQNQCYCIPSQEDCSCYKVQCPKSTALSADYKCRSNRNKAYEEVCKTIITRKDNSSTKETPIKFEESIHDISRQSVWIWLTFAVTIGICMQSGFYICIQYRHLCEPIAGKIYVNGEQIALNKDQFRKMLTSKWTQVKEIMEPSEMLDYIFQANAINQAQYDKIKQSRRDVQSTCILLHYLENQSDNVALEFQNMFMQTKKSSIMELITTPFTHKRWPRRDYEACESQICSTIESLKEKIEFREFLDICFGNLICSLNDYKYIVQKETEISKHEVNKLIIIKLRSLLEKGSFECLLEFTQNRRIIHDILTSNLPPAIFINLKYKTIAPMSPETKVLVDKRVKLQMQIPSCEHHIQLVFQDRIKYCSKWFIKELALYPDHTTASDDNSFECVPLIDDFQCRLLNSTSNGNFERLMEIYFCGKDVVRSLHGGMEIQISLLVVKSNNHNGNSGVEAPHYDMATFLSEQREFLLEELQPSVLLTVIPESCNIVFKHIDYRNQKRLNTAGDILDILDKTHLSEMFLQIVSTNDSFSTIHDRFLNLQHAYLRSSDVAANIIDDFVNVVTRKFDHNVIRNAMIAKNVLDKSMLNFTIGTYVDEEENIINFLVEIILAGQKAIGTFIHELYINGEEHLADRLSMSRVNDLPEYSDFPVDINNANIGNLEDVLLETRLKINFASHVS